MRINFDLAEVQAFVAVAEKLNFKAAADSVFISQPALSRRIEKLESIIGARLLARTTRHVALTDAGRQFLEHAYIALEELQKGMQRVTEETSRRRSLITVACIPSVASSLLPGILKSFAADYPETRIHIIDEGAQQVLASVVSGAADFGLNFIGAQEPDIAFQAVYTEEYCLAVHKDHPLAGRRSIRWKAVAGERFISVGPTSGNRVLVDNAIASLSKRPTTFYETRHVSGALGLVEAGLGVSAVPKLSLLNNIYPSVVGIQLTEPTVRRTLGLMTKTGRRLEPAAASLYARIAAFGQEV